MGLFNRGVVVPVLRFSGAIGMAAPLRPGLSLAALAGPIEKAFSMSRAKSVAVIINSPGGSPVQSSLLFRRLRQLADEKGKKIRLTEKETSILKYLYRAGEKPVTREELLAEVWGYNAGVTTHTLETHVYRLRQKIEPDPAHAKLLITEPGGYRLEP